MKIIGKMISIQEIDITSAELVRVLKLTLHGIIGVEDPYINNSESVCVDIEHRTSHRYTETKILDASFQTERVRDIIRAINIIEKELKNHD